jgi:prefoldin subunit 5
MSEKERSYKQTLIELVEELQGVKYSVTRLANEIETLDKTIRELIAVNQLLLAKLKDIAIPVIQGKLEPKERLGKVK